MNYTKIDVAADQISAAVRLFFMDVHPIAVHTLACAAREITTTLGGKLGTTLFMDTIAADHGLTMKETIAKAHKFAGFMKHADREPTAELTNFTDLDNDPVLFVACHDFGQITDGKPVEAQVFELWFAAVQEGTAPTDQWENDLFPGVRQVSRTEQKRIGQRALIDALSNPELRINFNRIVSLLRKD